MDKLEKRKQRKLNDIIAMYKEGYKNGLRCEIILETISGVTGYEVSYIRNLLSPLKQYQ